MSASRKRRLPAFAAAIAGLATVLVTRNALCKNRKKKPNRSRRSATYKRAAIIRPLNSNLTTPWKMILSCGTDDDFLTSVNVNKDISYRFFYPTSSMSAYGATMAAPTGQGRRQEVEVPSLEV